MVPKTLSKLGLKTAFGYIEKDPERNMLKLMETSWPEPGPTASRSSGTPSAGSSAIRTTTCTSSS